MKRTVDTEDMKYIFVTHTLNIKYESNPKFQSNVIPYLVFYKVMILLFFPASFCTISRI